MSDENRKTAFAALHILLVLALMATLSSMNKAWAASPSPWATPTSTLQLPSATTAYTAGQMIATNSNGTLAVVPSLLISNPSNAAAISRLRLTTNDATSTAWGAQTIQVDLWSAAPTFASGNGDRGTFLPATGTAAHIASYSCVMSAEFGDGAYAECSLIVGSFAIVQFATGSSAPVYWTLKATTGSGVTGASKVFTLTAEMAQ